MVARVLVALTIAAAGPAAGQGTPSGRQTFDSLLASHVRDGLVDYEAVSHDPRLERYLGQLAATDPASLPRAERLAFWINAYNAYTIALIVREGERKSIRNINRSFGLSLKGPWRERFVRVRGRTYTLDEVEHQVIRPEFREPRIHFALVCAATGCPPLRGEAYRADVLEAQLDDQARRFILASPDRNNVDVARARVVLSPIFDWYATDFGSDRAALGRYIARFHPPGPERALLESGRFDLRYSDYDWSLNIRTRR